MTVLALAHPGLFWTGLGLVSVPILIHLFFRRRHRVIRWAAMDFLLAALRKQKRRIEVENLLLLLVRCAGIFLLGLAVARPAVQAAGLNPFGGGARAVVLMLDTSTSMGAEANARTALDRAKEHAGEFVGDLPEGSKITLLVTRDDTAGGAPRALLENASPAEIRIRLPGVRLGYGPNDLGAAFRVAGEKLAALKGRRLVVYFSDLQRSDWYARDREARNEGVYQALRALDGDGEAEESTPLTLIDVGQADAANVVLAGLTVDRGRLAFAGKLLGVTASLVNYGRAPARGTLTLSLAREDGQWEKVETAEVQVDATLGFAVPGEEGGLRMLKWEFLPRVPPRAEGPLRFRAVFTPKADAQAFDRLAVDSERYLALRIRPPVRLLPVRTARDALEILSDAALLDVIELLPAIYPADLLRQDLSRVDVLVLADAELAGFTEGEALKIEAFVRQGGGLLAYLGEYARPQEYQYLAKGADGLLPFTLGMLRQDKDHPVYFRLEDKVTQAHPLLEQTTTFRSPAVTRYVRVSDYPESSVVARYDNGDPAVLERTFGRGRVVAVTTTPDERGFSLDGSLLPAIFFFNAAHYLVWEDPRYRNVTVGDPVTVPLPRGTRRVVVTPPEAAGGIIEEPVEDGTDEFLLADTAHPGFYRVAAQGVQAAGSAAIATETVWDAAANLDPVEGDLRRAAPARLRTDYQGTRLHFTEDVESVLPRSAAGDDGDMSRALLASVVVILFLELLLAWRFGARRRATA